MSVAQILTAVTALGENSTVLLYTAPAGDVFVEINVLIGSAISAGWYNGAQTTIYETDSTVLSGESISFGPLASGDKIFGTSLQGESTVAISKFQFDS